MAYFNKWNRIRKENENLILIVSYQQLYSNVFKEK